MGMPTWEDIIAEMKKREKEKKDFEKHLEKLRLEELEKRGLKYQKDTEKQKNDFHGDCDRPGTIENGTATLFWIVAMVVSLLFKGGWILCILETIVWWKFITRHKK